MSLTDWASIRENPEEWAVKYEQHLLIYDQNLLANPILRATKDYDQAWKRRDLYWQISYGGTYMDDIDFGNFLYNIYGDSTLVYIDGNPHVPFFGKAWYSSLAPKRPNNEEKTQQMPSYLYPPSEAQINAQSEALAAGHLNPATFMQVNPAEINDTTATRKEEYVKTSESEYYGHEEMMADFALLAKREALGNAGIDLTSEQVDIFDAASDRLNAYDTELKPYGHTVWEWWNPDSYVNYDPHVTVVIGEKRELKGVAVNVAAGLGGADFLTLNQVDVPTKSSWDNMIEKIQSASHKIEDGLDAWDFASNQLISTGYPPVMAFGTLSKLGSAGTKGLLRVGKVLSLGDKVVDAVKGSSKATKIIDGINIVEGKVGGKIPIEEFTKIRKQSIHNAEANSITLGKYTPTVENGVENWAKAGPDSYIAKAGDKSIYFDLGSEWSNIQKRYNLTRDEMFKYFNVPALDDAVRSGKSIRFSHDPRLHSDSYLAEEWQYLKDVYGFKSLVKEGDVWIAK